MKASAVTVTDGVPRQRARHVGEKAQRAVKQESVTRDVFTAAGHLGETCRARRLHSGLYCQE